MEDAIATRLAQRGRWSAWGAFAVGLLLLASLTWGWPWLAVLTLILSAIAHAIAACVAGGSTQHAAATIAIALAPIGLICAFLILIAASGGFW